MTKQELREAVEAAQETLRKARESMLRGHGWLVIPQEKSGFEGGRWEHPEVFADRTKDPDQENPYFLLDEATTLHAHLAECDPKYRGDGDDS
jgi:hypothetical protein